MHMASKPKGFESGFDAGFGCGRYCYATTDADEAVPGSLGVAQLWSGGVRSTVLVHFVTGDNGNVSAADEQEIETQLLERMGLSKVDFPQYAATHRFRVDLHVTPELVGRYA